MVEERMSVKKAERAQTFIIASRTLELVINPPRNKLSTNSLLLDPEHRHAILLCFAVPRRERKIVRKRFSLAVVPLLF
jgi:hypothetical protein